MAESGRGAAFAGGSVTSAAGDESGSRVAPGSPAADPVSGGLTSAMDASSPYGAEK